MSSNQTKIFDTMIGGNTTVNGDIGFSGVMHIDGKVEGSIKADSENDVLTISETGTIKGKVQAGNLVINGTVEGDITATGKIEVASQARINGNIYYVNIEMEAGSQVNGQLIYQGDDAQKLRPVEDIINE
ncbi:polymer-forming cytoskeletal protein [Marinicella sp. W31]|uniref:bactofilin family protein n=1 Tax=Marinicella sp. W31 TaxID=3023713 RepID=UPI00375740A2